MPHSITDLLKAVFTALEQTLERVDSQVLDSLASTNRVAEYFAQTVKRLIVDWRWPPLKPSWSNGRLQILKHLRSAAQRNYRRSRNLLTKRWLAQASNSYRK